jgi:hypothetical protein
MGLFILTPKYFYQPIIRREVFTFTGSNVPSRKYCTTVVFSSPHVFFLGFALMAKKAYQMFFLI